MTSPPPVSGARLRAVRVSTGTSMSGLAAAAGCSYGHLRMIERADRQPSPELLVRLVRALSTLAGRPITDGELRASEPAAVATPA